MLAQKLSGAGRRIGEVLKVVLPPAATFLVAYVVYPDFRASVWQLVDRVGPWVAVAVGLGALAVVALVLWRFWDQVIRPFKWLYLWLLWRLVVRPARDHFGVGVSVLKPSVHAKKEQAGVELPAEVHDVIVELTSNSLNLLNVALEAVWPSSPVPVVLKAPDAKSAERACEELELAKILSAWHVDETESGSVVELVLHRRLQSISKAKMLKMVNSEIVSRATRGRWVDHL